MKIELEPLDIKNIAEQVVEMLKPILLSSKQEQRQDDCFLDVKALCEYLKVSKRWIYERTRFHEIPFIKISKQEMRFNKQEINKWIESTQELVFNDYSGNVKTLRRK